METTKEQKLHENETDCHIILSKIDWNSLSPMEFKKINETLLNNQKLVKQQQRKSFKNTGNVVVNLRGNNYSIKLVDYQRLKSMKSEKSKQKLIDKIISENNKIECI